ncbi:enediyne biosynthesis protein UnbU [Flavobacteriaceae bacterium M23B6Z8]
MKKNDKRIPALIRFAAAITALNIAGHFFLGFEQSFAHAIVALATGYSVELIIEFVKARIDKRTPAFLNGGTLGFIYFLLPAHISSLAVSMLIFANVALMPVVFGVAAALLSKTIFRVNMKGRSRHFLNPSNTGIAVTFLLFPWVGSAPPYQFTESVSGMGDWILVGVFVTLGTFLNAKYTKKMPLILAWLAGFFIQAVIRTNLMDTATVAAIGPMTGVAFLLFTFYMVSDPSTTPVKFKNQLYFGFAVAFAYGALMALHVVFGLFFALASVCAARGIYFWILDLSKQKEEQELLPELKEELLVDIPMAEYADPALKEPQFADR